MIWLRAQASGATRAFRGATERWAGKKGGLVPVRLLVARVCSFVAFFVILHEDFKFTIFSSLLTHSPGAFKIVIFAGSNSGSPFGFGAVASGHG